MPTSNDTTQIPYGYCHCGCGGKTKLVKGTQTSQGRKKGEPSKFIYGHYKPQPRPLDNQINEFWDRVAITANDDLCWEWQARTYPNGYGDLKWNRRSALAHRVAWSLVNGEITDNLFVLHRCDNRKCVNPKHLFLGTHQQNMDDMVAKGRNATGDMVAHKGEKHPRHKLNHDQVITIRKRYAQGGVTWDELADDYNVSQSQIGRIIRNEQWKE